MRHLVFSNAQQNNVHLQKEIAKYIVLDVKIFSLVSFLPQAKFQSVSVCAELDKEHSRTCYRWFKDP